MKVVDGMVSVQSLIPVEYHAEMVKMTKKNGKIIKAFISDAVIEKINREKEKKK
jgi:hypothetical protein